MDERSLLHQLDGVRPGDEPSPSDHPELTERLASDAEARNLQKRIQQFDARLRSALHDAPIPRGLADRILASLKQAAPQAAQTETGDETTYPSGSSASPIETSPVSLAANPPLRRSSTSRFPTNVSKEKNVAKGGRNWRFWPAYAGALAASLLIAFFYWYSSPVEVSPEGALQWALEFHLNEPKTPGHPTDEVQPPKKYPFSEFLVQDTPLRWHRVTGLLGRSGVAYQWNRATLYVLPLRQGGTRVRIVTPFPHRPPDRPMMTTGGHAASAWQHGGLLYVLVVDGDRNDYRRLLRNRGGQLACSTTSACTACL